MKMILLIFFAFLVGCSSSMPPPLTEYQGKQLNFSQEYSIDQLGGGSSIFTIKAPKEEKILLNLYEPDEKLGITLYEGNGGVFMLSLAMTLDKYSYDLKAGTNKIVLYGEEGKAEFDLTVQ